MQFNDSEIVKRHFFQAMQQGSLRNDVEEELEISIRQ